MNNLYLLKHDIFSMFDLTRILFNDYYNGHSDNYNSDEIKEIKNIIESVEKTCKDIKEQLKEVE